MRMRRNRVELIGPIFQLRNPKFNLNLPNKPNKSPHLRINLKKKKRKKNSPHTFLMI